jgi:hypothetical protein
MKQPKVIGSRTRRSNRSTRKGTPIIGYVAGPPVLKEGARIIASGKVEYGLPSFIQTK